MYGLTECTLAAWLQAQSLRHANDSCIFAPGRMALSYAQLWQQVSELASALQALGATPATRVALVLPNGPEMATAFLGVASCATCAPLNPSYRASELRFYLQDLQARILVVRRGDQGPALDVAKELGLAVLELEFDATLPAGFLRLASSPSGLETDALPRPHDTALILHTSGTTARPKIVPLSQANLVASAHSIARHLALQPSDRCLNVMPLFHIHGLVGALLASVAGGGSVVCTPGFDERAFFDWTAQFEPTWYTAVPTIHQSVVEMAGQYREKAPRHTFRFVRSSSAALPPKVFEQLQLMTGAPVVEAFGMTEASHQMASNPLPPGVRKPGSVGIAAGADVALMDERGQLLGAGETGEIVIRGPGVFSGYENNPQANAQSFTDGWFRTGDQGRFDDEGYLFIVGRLKEMINRGGEKISPREIDEALLEHPAVAQAAAFAVPHPTLGEDLAAAVVLRPGARADEAGLRSFLSERLAPFKRPSSLVLVDAIPTGPTGKVQRGQLHEALGAKMSAAFAAPGNELERSIRSMMGEVLNNSELGIDDNFFAAGGDSLLAARLVQRIEGELQRPCTLQLLFRAPTVRQLALELESGGIAEGAEVLALQPQGTGPALFCICGVHLYQALADRFAPDIPVYGIFLPYEQALLEVSSPGAKRLPTVEEMAADYVQAIRQKQPRGPYCLAGASFGGLLAYEVARQLCHAGEQVSLLALLDATLPGKIRRNRLRWTVDLLKETKRDGLRALTERLRKRRQRKAQADSGDDEGRRIESARRAIYNEAARSYTLRSYDGPAILVLARDHRRQASDHEFGLRWRQQAPRLQTVIAAGDHLGILAPPHVHELAAHLRPHLESVRRG